MDNSLIDSSINDLIIYFLLSFELDPIANVTGSYFKEIGKHLPQIQIRNLDISINLEHVEESCGIIPIDVGGVCVTTKIFDIMIECGLSKERFKPMTIESVETELLQLITSPCYRICNMDPNIITTDRFFRGVIDPKTCCVEQVKHEGIGCIEGRNDYQDLILTDKCYKILCEKIDQSLPVISRPVYDQTLKDVFDEKLWPSGDELIRFESEDYLKTFTDQELLDLLNSAVKFGNQSVAEVIYRLIKKQASDFRVKKEAMLAYKAL